MREHNQRKRAYYIWILILFYEQSQFEIITTMTQRSYQIYANCVVNTSDSEIAFEYRGVCDHYNTFINDIKSNWHTNELGLNVIQRRALASISTTSLA